MKNPSLIDQDCAIGKALSFHNLRFRYSRPQARFSSGWSRRYKGYAAKASFYRAPPDIFWGTGILQYPDAVAVGADLVSAQNVAVRRIVAEQGKGRHKVCPYNDTAGHWGARAIENGELRALRQRARKLFRENMYVVLTI